MGRPTTHEYKLLTVGAEQRLLAEIALLLRQITELHDATLEQAAARPSPFDPTGPTTAEPASILYATFLGTFVIYRGESRLAFGHSKPALELCRYLIARAGQMVPRDELIDLLWPDVPADRGIHRLHVAISALRRILNGSEQREGCVQLGDESYAIDAGAVITDCHLFEHHYGRGKLCLGKNDFDGAAAAFGAGLELYKGDYLADHPYAEWTHQRRAHFAERRLHALAYLCEHALLENDLLAAVEYAQEILAIDNLRERTHRVLMRAHYSMGQRACAIRQYNSCAAYLRRELGVHPSQETQRLYQAICDDAPLPSEATLRP